MKKNLFLFFVVMMLFIKVDVLFAVVTVNESVVGNALPSQMESYKYDESDYGGALSQKVYNNTYAKDLYGTTYDLGIKYSSNGVNFCTYYANQASVYSTNLCNITNDWDSKTRAGVAAIINLVGGNVGDAVTNPVTKEYFFGTLAINTFLNGDSATKVDSSNQYYNAYYKAYLDAANNAKNNYPTFNISTNALSFEKKEGNYISNLVTVNTNIENYNVAVKVGDKIIPNAVEYSTNGFKILISESEIEIGKKVKIVATVTASKNTYHARNYDCGNDSDNQNKKFQTITPAKVEEVNINFSDTLYGEIEIKTSLTIKKVDENNKLLPGVVLKVESKENDYSETFTTTDKEIKIENLKFGKYTITEVSTPVGYVKLKESETVTISDNNLNATVTLNNSLNRVEISKISSVDGKLLPGAVLQIQDEDGNVLKNDKDEKYEWTTDDSVHVIYGLAPGTYYLAEVSSPDGYALNEERIEFIVDGEKEVIKIEMKNDIEVKVPDTLSAKSALLITISMFDIALGIGIITYVKKNKTSE